MSVVKLGGIEVRQFLCDSLFISVSIESILWA